MEELIYATAMKIMPKSEKYLREGGVSAGALSEEEKSMIDYPNIKQ